MDGVVEKYFYWTTTVVAVMLALAVYSNYVVLCEMCMWCCRDWCVMCCCLNVVWILIRKATVQKKHLP